MIKHLHAAPATRVDASELERRNRELATLHTLGQAIAESLDSHEVLERALGVLIEMGWFGCGEAYLRPPADSVELQTVAVGQCAYETVEQCPLRPALQTRVVEVLHDGRIQRDGSWHLVPVDDRALLALSGGEPSESFLAAVTDLVSASLKRAALHQRLSRKEAQRSRLLQALLSAQEEERGRISRDLHDQIGQALTAVLLGLDKELSERNSEELQRLKKLASVTLGDVRRIALDLRPSVLDELGLDAAIRRYARELDERMGLKVEVFVRLPERLSHEEEIVLYRVVQEALTNVVRHARAQEASVVITARDSYVQMAVEDDGVGFDPASLVAAEKIGLMGMRERIELLGGSFRIESRPGDGCTVYARLPLRRSYTLPRGNGRPKR